MTISTIPAPLRLGPYELIRRIATGGMAEVYLARRAGPHGFQKTVAVKRILPQFARDPDFVAMFVDEARVCARLGHPNIVQVFDFGEEQGELYMAMEYVDGTTGARLVRAVATRGEDIALDVCLHITLSILHALEYAHGARDEEGRPLSLVHRDVSPGNVLIDRSGAVKLTDFGIARAAEIERRTDAGQLKGKLGYMSPEQVVGRDLDERSDLFTLGIVLTEMLILRPLFSGGKELDVLIRIRDADLSAIDRAGPHVPDDVRAVLFRALSRDPALRWPSAAAFAEAIEEIVRRRRLQIGPSRLAMLIEKLGLVAPTDEEDGQPSADRWSREQPTSARWGRARASRRPAQGADRQSHGTRCLEGHHASGPQRVHLLGR
jgi:eukaryotic-like serine/threonine-protein kinase